MSMSTEVAVQPGTLAPDNQGDAQYLTFLINGEMFAINILGVKEIIEYGNITPIPMMPSFIRGV
ncbi:chemotaxis protein CheW, partial [Aeromonas hydrophila]